MYRSLVFLVIALALGSTLELGGPPQSRATLPFWAGPKIRDRYPTALIREHGLCEGDIAEVAVSSMPAESDEALTPEKVREFDAAGHVVQKWRMPIDTMVVAVTGLEIIVPWPYRDASGQGEALYIDPDGKFRLAALDFGRLSEPTQVKCPEWKEFGASAYVTGVIFRDLKDGRQRRVAYESPCT